jgi:phytoene synthase
VSAPRAGGPERGSNFLLGFLCLSKARREALSAVYAYCRLIDDIVDSGNLDKNEARRMLEFWRAEIERAFEGKATHSISQRLTAQIAAFRLPKEPFLEMIRGSELDLGPARYETLEQLESYMRGVASSVGLLSGEIFGYRYTPRERMREFATLFGYAFQLTNIIRDVGEDLELGRVYLPESDMKDAGYSREALLRREHDGAFDRLMEFEYKRARAYYQRARNLVDFRDRPALLPGEVMAHIYEGLLEEIRRTSFRVLYRKTSLSPWRKLTSAFAAWKYCHGIHGL